MPHVQKAGVLPVLLLNLPHLTASPFYPL
uniref:Uncharacterized protein n=1 Tax=Anguilla anguilla TaxID=7936 RepID=A0A0E9PY76_ANGAN